jgi:hypothetical protein
MRPGKTVALDQRIPARDGGMQCTALTVPTSNTPVQLGLPTSSPVAAYVMDCPSGDQAADVAPLGLELKVMRIWVRPNPAQRSTDRTNCVRHPRT